MSTRKIYILLTKFGDIRGRILSAMSGNYYTHVSLDLQEDPGTFYSFVLKGFRIETLSRYLKPGREPYPVKLYEIEFPRKPTRRSRKRLNILLHTRAACTIQPWVCFCRFCGFPISENSTSSVRISSRIFCSRSVLFRHIISRRCICRRISPMFPDRHCSSREICRHCLSISAS